MNKWDKLWYFKWLIKTWVRNNSIWYVFWVTIIVLKTPSKWGVHFRGAGADYRRLSPQPSIIWPKVGLLRIRHLIEPDFDFKSALLECHPTSFHNQIPLDEVIQPCSHASCVIFVSSNLNFSSNIKLTVELLLREATDSMHLPTFAWQLNLINPNEAELFWLSVSFLSVIELLVYIRVLKFARSVSFFTYFWMYQKLK